MIFVVRPAGKAIPASLLNSKECQRATEHLKRFGNLDDFDFQDYRKDDVKEALRAVFNKKCAYCESNIVRQPIDVEHYRPKGGVLVRGELQKPGYWWLAASWENLFPSCLDCNRRRRHENASGIVRLSGKENHFPLINERRRAAKPGDEKREKPLLLNPCIDRPDHHLVFPLKAEGQIQPKLTKGKADPKGFATIQAMALDDVDLTQARKRVWEEFQRYIRRVGRCRRELESVTNARARKAILERLDDEREGIEAMILPSEPYLAMIQPPALKVLKVIRSLLSVATTSDDATSPRDLRPAARA